MILEAISAFRLSPRTAIKTLKDHPSLVTQLSHYKVATEVIFACNVVIEPVTPTHLQMAQQLSGTYGLLTNNSLTVAVMQTLALTDVASNDGDLTAVSGLSFWRLQRGSVVA